MYLAGVNPPAGDLSFISFIHYQDPLMDHLPSRKTCRESGPRFKLISNKPISPNILIFLL